MSNAHIAIQQLIASGQLLLQKYADGKIDDNYLRSWLQGIGAGIQIYDTTITLNNYWHSMERLRNCLMAQTQPIGQRMCDIRAAIEDVKESAPSYLELVASELERLADSTVKQLPCPCTEEEYAMWVAGISGYAACMTRIPGAVLVDNSSEVA